VSWRQTVSGISMPASAATWPAHPPAALTTTGASIAPFVVSTPWIRPPATRIAVTSAPVRSVAPRSRAARMNEPAVIDGSA